MKIKTYKIVNKHGKNEIAKIQNLQFHNFSTLFCHCAISQVLQFCNFAKLQNYGIAKLQNRKITKLQNCKTSCGPHASMYFFDEIY